MTKSKKESRTKGPVSKTGRPGAVEPKRATEKVSIASADGQRKSRTTGLSAAKTSKKDEFYTQYVDIQKEVEAYLEFDPETFQDKIVYCNADDPFESNFFKYFAANFNRLGIRKLISTSYDGSPIAGQLTLFPEYNEGNAKERKKPKAVAVVLDRVQDEDGDGAASVTDVELFLKRNKAARIALKGDEDYPGGDFRSQDCIALLKEADLVVTNPPFSLFREYIAQLIEHKKRFLIIGNVQAITYKEVFPLISDNRVWMGATIHSGDREFRVPDYYPLNAAGWRVDDNGIKYIRVKGVRWYTNLDHGRRHEKLKLMTMADNLRYNKKLEGNVYEKYENYDAMEVPFTDAIPSDYDGVMGVPITFLDKYNPDQFEIVGTTESNDPENAYRTRLYTSRECRDAYLKRFGKAGVYDLNASGVINGVKLFKRVLIRHRCTTPEAKTK